ERVSSYYFGAGPHLGFDFWRVLPVPGLELCSRLGGALTVGKVHQQFEESLLAVPGSGSASVRKVRESPMIHFEAGLSYAPPWPSGGPEPRAAVPGGGSPPPTKPERLKVPPELPGAGGPRVTLPPTTAPAKEREAAINKLFPALPTLGDDPQPSPGPDGRPL